MACLMAGMLGCGGGPPTLFSVSHAITGRDGEDTTDRWEEALLMKERALAIWNQTSENRREGK
jgi:hypothetical protein